MALHPYIGSGPYCYAYCIAMMLGDYAPSVSIIEVATGSPFGMQMIDGLPFFDPMDWDPLTAMNETLVTLGWRSEEYAGKDAEEALAELRSRLHSGPVLVGPVDQSFLSYQPGFPGSDHYVVVLEIDDMVHVHDPGGHPYAVLPVKDFLDAWGAVLPYGKPYSMRYGFERVEAVGEDEIVRRTLLNARRWLAGSDSRKAAETAAQLMHTWTPAVRGHMAEFAIRVGARRVADAAVCLSRFGYEDVSKIMTEQAKLLGSLQYYVRVKNSNKSAEILSQLSLTYLPLREVVDAKMALK